MTDQRPDYVVPSFDTPEAAALSDPDIGPRFARVVGVRYHDDNHATVELATNEPPVEYAYFVYVERVQGRWLDVGGNN